MDLTPLEWGDLVDHCNVEWGTHSCPTCQKPTPKKYTPRKDKHAGDIRCEVCEHFFGFMPSRIGEKKRPKSSTNLAIKYGIEFCEMCLRHKDELPSGQVIEGHHVIEHSDGGTDERSNVWGVCTYCHGVITHIRHYIGHHKVKKATPDASIQSQKLGIAVRNVRDQEAQAPNLGSSPQQARRQGLSTHPEA